MKSFKFKYSVPVYVLLVIILALTLAGLGLNVFNLISYFDVSTYKFIVYCILSLLNVILFVLALSVLFGGKYVITKEYLYTCFGFIKIKSDINEIISIVLFKKSEKCVIYFKDAKYTVIVIDKSQYEQFVLSLRELNPKITYSAKTDGEDTPE